MNLREALGTAVLSLAAHKLRTCLAMLGVVFGVGAVIAMLSIGAGAEQQALELIEQLGTRNVIVRGREFPDEELRELRERSPGLSLRDRDAIVDAVPGVEVVEPRTIVPTWRIAATTAEVEAKVLGVTEVHQELSSLELATGRFLDALDVREHAQVAVIGSAVHRDLFGTEPAVGQLFKVNDVWIEVVGVLAGADSQGSSDNVVEGVSFDSPARTILIPVTTALRKFDRRPLDSPLNEIVVRTVTGAEAMPAQATARTISQLLGQLHGGTEDFELVVPEALLEQSRATQRLFNIVMGCIAGISLLVGGIGIMNIMLATVLERTREIGVRRAVGAKKRDIVTQFLVESFSISFLGGVAGVVLGVGIAQTIAAAADWPTIVRPLSVLLSVGVALSVGLCAGLYPAVRAAELDPIDSLRYE